MPGLWCLCHIRLVHGLQRESGRNVFEYASPGDAAGVDDVRIGCR